MASGRIPSAFQTLLILCYCLQGILGDCPRLCECKWKSGKESVICLNANLSSVPLHLDAGTQILDLTGNNVVTITHDEFSVAGLLNLQKVYISKCRLKTLDRYAFRHLTNLVELDLSYNVLTAIPSHTFDSIPELRELRLSGNPIQRIVNNAFIHLPQLVRLEMSSCKISAIELRGFVGLESSLEWLYIDNNRLSDIRSTTLTSLQSLHGLELAGNSWNCSCSLRPLREWMLRYNVPFGVPPICKYPARLAGKTWDRLDLDEFACAPEIKASIPQAHGVEGLNVTMSCRIAGIPEPSVRWLLKNRVIANLSGGAQPYTNGRKLYMVHLRNNASNLTILTADVQDAGVYVCAAENKAGRAEASVTLAVSRRPPAGPLSAKLVVVCGIIASLVSLSFCLLAVCVCNARRRRKRGAMSRRREESYEKIEMNHKVVTNRVIDNTGPSHSGNGIGRPLEVGVAGPTKRRGDYRGVPSAESENDGDEDDDPGYEEDMDTTTPTPTTITSSREVKHWPKSNDTPNNIRWSSDTREETDLHIPRRIDTYADHRDDRKKLQKSKSGIYNEFSRSASSSTLSASNLNESSNKSGALPNVLHPHVMRKQALDNNAGYLYTTAPTSDDFLSPNNYPDLLELPSYSSPADKRTTFVDDERDRIFTNKNNIFCTLPRKSGIYQKASARCNQSTDSQSPLLADSRYSSSGGEDNINYNYNSNRRVSMDSPSLQYPLSNISGRVGQRASSFINLASDRPVPNRSLPGSPISEQMRSTISAATPLLDINCLDTQTDNAYISQPNADCSPSTSANANTYDYHAAQLERFLEEYRSLQDQLNKMKETCEGIRQQNQKSSPVMFLDPLLINNGPPFEEPPKSILKKPTMASVSPLSGNPPDVPSPLTLSSSDYTGKDPPPYWLAKSGILNRYNSDNYHFQS